MKETLKNKKIRALEIAEILGKTYVDATCSLNYENALQLLVATQLAAQCTDERVNMVTENLFKKYKDVYDFASADLEELQEDIKSTAFTEIRQKYKGLLPAYY